MNLNDAGTPERILLNIQKLINVNPGPNDHR
jgi:hypothetical protein